METACSSGISYTYLIDLLLHKTVFRLSLHDESQGKVKEKPLYERVPTCNEPPCEKTGLRGF